MSKHAYWQDTSQVMIGKDKSIAGCDILGSAPVSSRVVRTDTLQQHKKTDDNHNRSYEERTLCYNWPIYSLECYKHGNNCFLLYASHPPCWRKDPNRVEENGSLLMLLQFVFIHMCMLQLWLLVYDYYSLCFIFKAFFMYSLSSYLIKCFFSILFSFLLCSNYLYSLLP